MEEREQGEEEGTEEVRGGLRRGWGCGCSMQYRGLLERSHDRSSATWYGGGGFGRGVGQGTADLVAEWI